MDELLAALRAGAEQTRLRIIAVLSRTELTVSELCKVLGQSQPRVSRHLKLLCDAGLLQRNAEGNSAFYRPSRSGTGRLVLDAISDLIDSDDPVIQRDWTRLENVRQERGTTAAAYFADVAADWDQLRSLHVDDAVVEQALLQAVGDRPIGDLLDVGTGSGRILEVFSDRCDRGLGIDLSRQMLNVARTRLDQQKLRNCSVRQGDIYNLELPAGSMDVVVAHHVLHFLDAPGDAIEEAARTLRPGGQLLIVDFAAHQMDELRTEFAHRRLGLRDEDVTVWCEQAGLQNVTAQHLDKPQSKKLTVTVWSATQHRDAPDYRTLEITA